MNQSAWGVDVSSAIAPMLDLVEDTDALVRQSAAYAIGNFAKVRRYDLTPFIDLMANRLYDESVHVRNAAGWALWRLSGSRDIGSAVPHLIRAMKSQLHYDGPRKSAAGALLSFARRSPQNREHVRQLATAANLDPARKEVRRFLLHLSASQTAGPSRKGARPK